MVGHAEGLMNRWLCPHCVINKFEKHQITRNFSKSEEEGALLF
jgi:hypothetical protein